MACITGTTFRIFGGFVLLVAAAVAADRAAVGAAPIPQIESGGHLAQCSALIFTPDGRNLISAGDDKVVRVWDVRDPARPRLGRSIRLQVGDGAEGMIYAAALASRPLADGVRLLAVAGYTRDNEVRLIDFDRGQVLDLLKGHTNVIHGLAFSADGRQLASASSDGTVRVWDLEAFDVRPPGSEPSEPAEAANARRGSMFGEQVPCTVLGGHAGAVFAVAFAEWASEELGRGARVEPVAVPLLASGGQDGLIRVWRGAGAGRWQPEPASILRGHQAAVCCLVASPDGRRLASAALDRAVRLWDLPTGASADTLTTLPGDGTAAARLAMPPDGRELLIAASRRRGGSRVVSLAGGEQQVAFTADDNTVTAAAFSPDGRVIATASLGEFAIRLRDARTGALRACIQGGGQAVWALGFSADGQRLAFGTRWSGRNTARIWQARPPLERVFDLNAMRLEEGLGHDADQPQADAKGRTPQPWRRATLESDGLTATSTDGRSLLVMRGDQIVARIHLDHPDDELRCFSFVPSVAGGQQPARLTIGSDYELGLYDAASGRKLQRLVGHLASVWCLAASPDGRWLASGSADQTFRLWSLRSDAADQSPTLSFFVTRDGQWIVWAAEGYYKASMGGRDLIGWHINQGPGRAARFVNAWQMRHLYERPGIVERVLAAGSVRQAIEQHNADSHQRPETLTDVRDQLADQLPPQAVILAPRPQTVVQSSRVRLEAEIRLPDTAAPPARVFVRVMVNTRPVPGWEDRPLAVASPEPEPNADGETVERNTARDRATASPRIEVDVPLVPGENAISVFAHTEAVGGEVAEVAVTSRPNQPRNVKSDLYVLAIGVSDYQDQLVKDLEFADDDAMAVVQALQAQEGRLFNRVHSTTLVNSQATKRNILKAVEALVRQATQIDLVIVAVSGHGERDLADRYFFIPHDFEQDQLFATAVRWSDFQEPLGRLPCPVVLIMDTCHSAGVTGRDPTARERLLRQDSHQRAIAELANIEAGLLVLSSALSAEIATESQRWGHGAFVLALLEAIQSRHLFDEVKDTPLPADGNGDGIVDLVEIRDYVVHRVKELTKGKQHALSQPKDLPKVPIAVVERRPGG